MEGALRPALPVGADASEAWNSGIDKWREVWTLKAQELPKERDQRRGAEKTDPVGG